jgi:hypothetical protein
LAAGLVMLVAWTAQADPRPGHAEVRGVKGSATVSTNGGAALPLQRGAVLYSGSVIKTGTNSTVDLFLGPSAGNVRVSEETTLILDKLLATETGADTAVEVQLHLPEGEMYFDVNKLSKASRYEIKMPSGVAGIRGTRGCLCVRPGNSKPPVVLLEGKLYFVQAGPGGDVSSHTLSAPPAVYFNAADNTVKPATAQVVQQVEKELGESKKQTARKPEPNQAKSPPQSEPPKQTTTSEPFLSPGTGVRAREKNQKHEKHEKHE